jgi:hypothetical protein
MATFEERLKDLEYAIAAKWNNWVYEDQIYTAKVVDRVTERAKYPWKSEIQEPSPTARDRNGTELRVGDVVRHDDSKSDLTISSIPNKNVLGVESEMSSTYYVDSVSYVLWKRKPQ